MCSSRKNGRANEKKIKIPIYDNDRALRNSEFRAYGEWVLQIKEQIVYSHSSKAIKMSTLARKESVHIKFSYRNKQSAFVSNANYLSSPLKWWKHCVYFKLTENLAIFWNAFFFLSVAWRFLANRNSSYFYVFFSLIQFKNRMGFISWSIFMMKTGTRASSTKVFEFNK